MAPSLAVIVLDDVADPRTLAPITRGVAGYVAVASFLIGVPVSVTAASLAAIVTLVRWPLLPTTWRIAGTVPWLVLGVEVVLVMWLADEYAPAR